MSHKIGVFSLVVAWSVFLLSTASVAADGAAIRELTADEIARIEQGDVVFKATSGFAETGARGARIHAYCIINKPPDAAWAVILNYHRFAEFMPRLEKVDVIERTPHTMKVTETVRVPLLGVIVYTIDLIFAPAQQTVRWTLDKSRPHDIAETFGSWELLAYREGRTMIRYTSTLDSGKLVPRFLEEAMAKRDLSNALLSLKRRTESDGAWKKMK